MKLLAIIAVIFFVWIAFDLLWSIATLALFGLLAFAVLYVGYKLIWGRW